jgi:hypothetical protein
MSIDVDDEIWEPLIEKIQEEKCVLVIGPDIASPQPGQSIMELLKDYLATKPQKGKDIKFYGDDEFFLFADNTAKAFANIRIKKFYEGLAIPAVYNKIAEIPFHLIISVSPDHLLKTVFETGKLPFSFDFFNKEQNPAELEKPTKDKPLVYNLFGDIDADSSLVFTYDDLFSYLSKIFGDFKLPQSLQYQLKNCETVLFVGFQLEKWYFRLLLRLLKINEVGIKGASDKSKSLVPSVRNFYADEFGMEFIEADEVEIIDYLHSQFDAKHMLRAAQLPKHPSGDAIYISYAWEGEREQVVNDLYNTLIEKGYNVIRDKVDLGYKGDIQKFMELIGTGAYVIVVISDKYLKSPNCMYEMKAIVANNSKDIQKRIFPIVMADALIYDPETRLDYMKYWEDKKKSLEAKYRGLDSLSYTADVRQFLDNYDDFRRIMDYVTQLLANINTLTPAMHEGNNFSSLMKALDDQIQEDNPK